MKETVTCWGGVKDFFKNNYILKAPLCFFCLSMSFCSLDLGRKRVKEMLKKVRKYPEKNQSMSKQAKRTENLKSGKLNIMTETTGQK